jgi:hypothetical protein
MHAHRGRTRGELVRERGAAVIQQLPRRSVRSPRADLSAVDHRVVRPPSGTGSGTEGRASPQAASDIPRFRGVKRQPDRVGGARRWPRRGDLDRVAERASAFPTRCLTAMRSRTAASTRGAGRSATPGRLTRRGGLRNVAPRYPHVPGGIGSRPDRSVATAMGIPAASGEMGSAVPAGARRSTHPEHRSSTRRRERPH